MIRIFVCCAPCDASTSNVTPGGQKILEDLADILEHHTPDRPCYILADEESSVQATAIFLQGILNVPRRNMLLLELDDSDQGYDKVLQQQLAVHPDRQVIVVLEPVHFEPTGFVPKFCAAEAPQAEWQQIEVAGGALYVDSTEGANYLEILP